MATEYIRTLINPLFYDPTLDKSISSKETTYKEIREIFGSNALELHPLQYQDKDTTNFSSGPRIFWTEYNNELWKIRLCNNPHDAENIFERTKFAKRLSIPISEPIKIMGKYIILKYEPGNILSEESSEQYINEISQIQSKMNIVRFDEKVDKQIDLNIEELCNISLKGLQKNLGHESTQRIKEIVSARPKIIATYDHQDYGLHNIIKTHDSRIILVDEEAFGILPLGYGVIRPIFDRPNYRISANITIEEYLKHHSAESREYILTNMRFFKAVFILRNSYRRLRAGNHIAAQKLLAEAREL